MSTKEAVDLLFTEIDMCRTCREVAPYICHQHDSQLREIDDAIEAVTDRTGDAA